MADMPSPSPHQSPASESTAAKDITNDALSLAAKDDVSMRALLEGGETERIMKVERVRLALDTLKKGMVGLNDTERMRIARVSRELMDSHLESVRTELQTNADEQLKDLETKISSIRDVASKSERTSMPMMDFDSINLEMKEVARELAEGDWKTWAKYAAAAAAGGMAMQWVWNHTFGALWKMAAGSKEKPTFLRRAAGWVAGLGGAALGVFAFSRLTADGTLPSVLAFAKKATETTAKGAKEGLETGVGTTYNNVAAAFNFPHVNDVQKRLEAGEFKETDLSYTLAYYTAMARDGIDVVWEGTGAGHLVRGGTHLFVQDVKFFSSLSQFIMSGGGNAEAGWNAYEVWVNGAVVYATSFGALSTAITVARTPSAALKPLDLIKTLAGESAVWPVTVAGKAKGAVMLIATENGRVTLREIAGIPKFHWNRIMENWVPFRSQTTNRMQALVNEWKGWKELERSVRGGGDDVLIKSLQDKCNAIEKNILASAQGLREQRGAGQALDLTSDLRHIVNNADNLDTVTHALNQLADVNGHKLAGLADTWIDLQRALRDATTGLEKSRITERIEQLVEDLHDTAKALKAKIDAGKTVDGLTPSLKTLVEEGTDKIKLTRYLQTGTTTAEGTKAGAGAAKGAKDAAQAGAATEAVADAAETGDEWARATAQARKALLAPNATNEAIAAVDEAVSKCKALGLVADDAVKALKDPNVLLALTRTPANQVNALAVAIEGGDAAANMKRLCAFIATFADHLDDAAKATILLDKSLLRTVIHSGLEADAIADILKNPAVRNALLEGKNVEKIMKDLIWWKNATSLHTMMNVGGAVISAAMLVNDILTLADRRKQLTDSIKNLGADLQKAGFKKDGEDYVHTTSKKRICMSVVESNIDNMSNPQWLRVAGSAAGTVGAIGTLAFPAMAVNPLVGLAILGVEITVQGAATVWEDENTRQFLLDTPTSVLSVIDLNNIVQKDSKAVLDDASTWMWSDIVHSGETNVNNKDVLRKKAVSVMFFQELNAMAKESPEVAAHILRPRGLADTQDGDKPLDAGSFLDEDNGAFWVEDYEKIIKPFLAARLFQMSKDGGVKWSEFRDLKIDEGVFDLENIAPADMRLALREAAHLYAQHLKERDYLDQKKKVESNTTLPVDEKILTVQSISIRAQRSQQLAQGQKDLQVYGDQAVFGKKVSELDDGSGVTATERYLQDLTKRLDSRADITVAETQKAKDEIDGNPLVSISPVTANMVGPRGDERSMMGTKEIFTGKNPAAEGNVRLEDAAGVSGRDVERPISEAKMQSLIEKGRSVYDALEGVGTWGKSDSVWYAQPSHFQQLKEYSYALQRSPILLKEQSVASFLTTVKHLGEGFSWEDGYLGSEFLAKRNDAFREALVALRTMNRSLDARTYHIAKPERASAYTHVLCLPNQTAKIFTDFDKDAAPPMRGDPSVLYVERDGETIEIKPPTAGQTYSREIPGYGTFACQQEGYMSKGKPAYHYRWTFQRAPEAKHGANDVYAYFKYDGAEQPGTKISLPEVKRYKKQINVDLPLVLDDPSNIATGARITISYVSKEGETVNVTGSLHEIITKHPIGWRGIRNTDPTTKMESTWMRFVSKDGAQLVGCTIDYLSKPMSVDYVWKPQQAAPLAKEQPAPTKKINRAA